ncbi:Ser-Thr-rich glycosyl-phosphatidyl-inositol-anchored membrane family-domain-containing protein [Hypoxylon fragiforme]|uniref:Ser-Thr-rich glycosyl-phosphatidyl-inositol-anchored membrane family-domain-containing protein n=1 Tax=Hypoxylon fragiforme TaxID=63214 RepID=UPI0020C5FB8D|nr:Ser-Thr-rich glycosyl-phosphatidyl-inositol-anchored membrane family-domain-containing protein [Hypoxylon fragiforme]KAI2613903.1 Ser-Thr-rich glycosyl-phosphatidyl-inositol-anchored membrane family-domain-containing protein [Hypoxylon fragiforme]
MRSAGLFAAAMAFAASVIAQTPGYAVISQPGEGSSLPSGKEFEIKWEAGAFTGPATISLLAGESPTTLQAGATIGTVDVASNKFTWKLDCSLGTDKTYGIKITSAADPNTFQYSFPFAISGPSCGAAETSATASASASVSATKDGYATEGTTASSSTVSISSYTTAETTAETTPGYPLTTPSYPGTTVLTNTSTTVPEPSYPATVPTGNLSTTAVPSYPASTTLTYVTGTPSTTSPVTVVTGAANAANAGPFALFGGLAVAMMAL